MMKNKKVIATIAASTLLVLGGTTAFFMTAEKPEGDKSNTPIEQKFEVTVKEKVEYGSDLSEKTFVVNTASGEKEAKFSSLTPAIDTSKVGKTTHSLTLENEKFEVEVTVADTVKPEISGVQEKFEFESETNVEAELKKSITAKDPVDGDLEVVFEITAKENTKNVFNVVATAVDKNENTTSEKFEVVVKEKVAVSEPTNSGETSTPANEEKPAQTPAQTKPSAPTTQTPAQTKPATPPAQTPAQTKPATPPAQTPAQTKPATPPAQTPAQTKPATPPAQTKPATPPAQTPAPSQPSTGGSSADYPNGTVTLVGSVPSGATVTSKLPDGYMYKFAKSLPSGARIETVTVSTYNGKQMVVSMRIFDASNVMGSARLHADGSISYTHGYPDLTDADMGVIRSLESQFRAAFKHNK